MAEGTFAPNRGFSPPDEGRFAPQAPSSTELLSAVAEGSSSRGGDRSRKTRALPSKEEDEGGDKVTKAAWANARQRQAQAAAPQPAPRPRLTPEEQAAKREEAKQRREKHNALWNRQSGSKRGRERSQPDLGARMKVMLDKIKRNHAAEGQVGA